MFVGSVLLISSLIGGVIYDVKTKEAGLVAVANIFGNINNGCCSLHCLSYTAFASQSLKWGWQLNKDNFEPAIPEVKYRLTPCTGHFL